MKTKAELQTRLAQIDTELTSIISTADNERRPLTADDRTNITKFETEFEAVTAEIKQLDDDEKLRARVSVRSAGLKQSAGRKAEPAPLVTPGRETTSELGQTASYYENTDEEIKLTIGDIPGAQVRRSYGDARRENNRFLKSSGYQPWGEFKNFSDFVRAGFDGHQHSEFRDRHRKHFAAVQGMSETVGSDGGYTIMPEFAGGIIDRVYQNDLWSRTDNYAVSGNNMTFLANAETSRATGSRHGGMQGYWVQEGATITKSKPTLREVTMKLVKLGVVVYLTNELIEDGGTALQTYVARKASQEFEFLMGNALVNGTGVGQPLGIANAPSLVSVAKENGQLASTLLTENFLKMYARFYGPGRSNMIWLHNQDTEPQLFGLVVSVNAGGLPVFIPAGGLSSSPYGSVLGRPLITTEFNATLGTQFDVIAADLGQMLSISKGGVAQAVSMHIEFLTDQLALRFLIRCNAGPWESAPITPFKGTANTQANFVTLDSRT